MRIFGIQIGKSAPRAVDSRGWFPLIREPYSGAWQENVQWSVDTVLANATVYTCITAIASDIAKMPARLVRRSSDGVWTPVSDPRGEVLRKPNRYQNHIQFKEWWMTSKLSRGNTYGLKERDPLGRVVRIYILDPGRVSVQVTADGQVFYQCAPDNLGNTESVMVPASEMIHDRMNCLFHPLVGVSPLYASGLAAWQGMKIQEDSTRFFGNSATPGGVLTAPGAIGNDTAARLKAHWDANYTGVNAGKVAVLGDGLKFEPMRMTATDAQLIEQLKWTAETVCATFHVPAYRAGVGAAPSYNNIEALDQAYYSGCLQIHIEAMELALDEGLELPDGLGTELDLDVLLRMDTATRIDTLTKAVGGTLMTPNEARRRLNLAPLEGGDTVYSQVQNYSLAALAERDAAHPLLVPDEPAPAPVEPVEEPDEAMEDQALMLSLIFEKELASVKYS